MGTFKYKNHSQDLVQRLTETIQKADANEAVVRQAILDGYNLSFGEDRLEVVNYVREFAKTYNQTPTYETLQ